MKYLNIGCGNNYSTNNEWTNLDFVANGIKVMPYNLLKGIPFENNNFDLVYHSHLLEHFTKDDGEKMIEECFRVLKPGGVLRIAVPDLEQIIKNYLNLLEIGNRNPADEAIRINYDWIMLEMYDQTVRNYGGGKMGAYIMQETLKNENFIFDRIGEEGKIIRNNYLTEINSIKLPNSETYKLIKFNLINKIKLRIKNYLLKQLNIDKEVLSIGQFRLAGEIHQWMYDSYSLKSLLMRKGGIGIKITDAFSGYIKDWEKYNLDGKNGIVRKPDSFFIEALK